MRFRRSAGLNAEAKAFPVMHYTHEHKMFTLVNEQ